MHLVLRLYGGGYLRVLMPDGKEIHPQVSLRDTVAQLKEVISEEELIPAYRLIISSKGKLLRDGM
jgi:Ubiquitin family